MAARNCIFVKCFFEKTQKSAPLQLNFECSGVFWLNLVTLGSRAESYFINLLENAKCRDVLEKEYHFTPNDFYVMNKEE